MDLRISATKEGDADAARVVAALRRWAACRGKRFKEWLCRHSHARSALDHRSVTQWSDASSIAAATNRTTKAPSSAIVLGRGVAASRAGVGSQRTRTSLIIESADGNWDREKHYGRRRRSALLYKEDGRGSWRRRYNRGRTNFCQLRRADEEETRSRKLPRTTGPVGSRPRATRRDVLALKSAQRSSRISRGRSRASGRRDRVWTGARPFCPELIAGHVGRST